MRLQSTSLHAINADKPRKGLDGPLWFLFNWLNNHIFPNAASHLQIRKFTPDVSDENWARTYVKSSPTRKLSDLFWMQLPWAEIQSTLETINVLDVGCGSGHYYERLQEYSGNRLATYTGMDIASYDNWEKLSQKFQSVNFLKVDSADIFSSIPGNINLIISQSALEHFEKDLEFFLQVSKFVQQTSANLIQIHLIPSSACLALYLFHGVRQYTPRTVSHIAKLFHPFSYSILFELGGKESNLVHWNFITKPTLVKREDLRDNETETYEKALRNAILIDNGHQYNPSFYALVIHSHFKEVIF